MAPPVQVTLNPRARTSDREANILTVALVGIRRMQVILQVSNVVHGESNEVMWTLSAWAKLETSLGPNGTIAHVNVAPSQVTLAPLGAQTMHVATVYWPPEPAAASLSVKFSTAGDIPQGLAQAWGVGDTTPHDVAGLFVTPFGYPRHFERLVDPLPYDDPELLERLQIDGRIPTPLLLRRSR
jgi:hypothetical protein